MTAYDSYIFDMDGTLWDAVDSYCEVWNRTFDQCGVAVPPATRGELEPLMGKPIGYICDVLTGGAALPSGFMERLAENERTMMPHLGGTLYPGVRRVLETLRDRGAKLLMVSNCGRGGIANFLRFTGLEDLVADHRAFGDNGCEKDVNIADIVRCHKLAAPVYVGDTEGDRASAHAAGVPFAWAAYGFGRDLAGYDARLDTFSDLLNI